MLIPTQEQAAVLAAFPGAIRGAGTAVAVPSFEALRRAQDKVSAASLLADARLPQPEFAVVRGVDELLDQPLGLPVFIKAMIGTAMVQSVFADGELLAHHVNLRLAEGAGGGASRKQSARLPVIAEHLRRVGHLLGWHGALSLDCILTPSGPLYIDLNPRLDLRALIPPAIVTLGLMALPAAWRHFASGATRPTR